MKKNNILEEHLYYGQILAKAKLIKDDKIINNYDNLLNNNQIKEKINLAKYGFWLDLYQLRFMDDKYVGVKIDIEYQYSTYIGVSEGAIYNPNRKKFYWNNEDRRLKRVNLEMGSNLDELPFCFIRIKLMDEYIGYIKFDIKYLINKLEVKPSWMKIRKCEVNFENYEDSNNYVGELFCAFNVFIDNKNELTKRPALIDNSNYKNFILISRIYMGKNFPLINKKQASLCEVQFYNNLEKPVKTQEVSETANPTWMKTLFFQTKLNENLEFTQNIKLIAKLSIDNKSEITVGTTGISINNIDVYRDERQFEKEKMYKKAKWYTLDHAESKDKCYILARFILLIIPKQDKETIIKLKNILETDKPEKIRSYFKFFIIGFRNLSESLEKTELKIKYGDDDLIKKGVNKNSENYQYLNEIVNQNYKKGSLKEKEIYNYNILFVRKNYILSNLILQSIYENIS